MGLRVNAVVRNVPVTDHKRVQSNGLYPQHDGLMTPMHNVYGSRYGDLATHLQNFVDLHIIVNGDCINVQWPFSHCFVCITCDPNNGMNFSSEVQSLSTDGFFSVIHILLWIGGIICIRGIRVNEILYHESTDDMDDYFIRNGKKMQLPYQIIQKKNFHEIIHWSFIYISISS